MPGWQAKLKALGIGQGNWCRCGDMYIGAKSKDAPCILCDQKER
jgi:hypothetical protein